MVKDKSKRPFVGVVVIVIRDDYVLLGKRKNSHGQGEWGFPGGHLEYGEDEKYCAKREVKEETGLEIDNLRIDPYTDDMFNTHLPDGKHYVTLYVIADYVGGEAQVMEPDKCEKWDWFAFDDLPHPLFMPIYNLLHSGRTLELL